MKLNTVLPSRSAFGICLAMMLSPSFTFADTPTPAPKAEVKTAPKVVVKPAPKVVVKPAPKVVVKPAPKAVVKPAPKAVVKPAPKAVVKPAPKAVVKPAPKAVVKPAPKAVVKPAPKAETKSGLAAQIGDQTLTIAAVDQMISAELKQARLEFERKLYELRSQAVERFLSEKSIQLQLAKSKVSTIAELFEKEAFTQLKDVSDAEVSAFYKENKDRIGDRPEEEVKPMIKDYLGQQRKEEVGRAYIMKIRGQYKGKSFLEPPRVQVKAKGFSKGPKDAAITIIEFADYECGFCSRVLDSVDAVMKKYPGKVRVVFRDFPLNFHPNATPAALAARCAGAQGKFWEMHDLLFKDQSGLTTDNYKKWAGDLKLDSAAFDKCLADPEIMAAIQADLKAGSAVGVNGTPAFFVNGVSLSGAQPLEAFVTVIDQELARLGIQ
jgi:protein-disulfide isomerase